MADIPDDLVVELTDAIIRLSRVLEGLETQGTGHLVSKLVDERFKSVTRG